MRSEHAMSALAMAMVALVGLAGVSAAHAGFVDERGAPAAAEAGGTPAAASVSSPAASTAAPVAAPSVAAKPVAAAASAPSAAPALFAGAGWSEPAPRVAQEVALNSAIAVLVPSAQGAVSIEGSADLLARKVSWPVGLTRSQAMAHLSNTYGAAFALSDHVMRVSSTSAPAPALAATAVATTAPTPASAAAVATRSAAAPAPAPAPAVLAAAAPVVKIVQPTLRTEFTVSPSDGVFRNVLKRWASAAGYTFDDTHWAAPRDVPVAAGASLGSDFKVAVRTLLDSTQLGSMSMPLRPCFYSNAVLRVVPRHEQCDRTPAAALN